jgi:hypothetical protein
MVGHVLGEVVELAHVVIHDAEHNLNRLDIGDLSGLGP